MATTPIYVILPSGRSGDVLKLYAEADDAGSIANGAGGDTLAETFSGSGKYKAEVAESITGTHLAVIENSSGNLYANGWVEDLEDTTASQYVRLESEPNLKSDIANSVKTKIEEDGSTLDGVKDTLATLETEGIKKVGPDFDADTQKFELVIGDDYVAANSGNTDFEITFTDAGNEDNWTVKVGAYHERYDNFTGSGSIVESGGTYYLRVEWPKANLPDCPADDYLWQAKLINPAGEVRTKFEGVLELKRNAIPSS